MLNQQKQLEGKLQDLRAWVGNTNLILSGREYNSETDANGLNQHLQQYEVNSAPIFSSMFYLSFELYQFCFPGRETSIVLIFLRKPDFPFQK